VLVLVKLHGTSTAHGGTAKSATGAVFPVGVVPPSSPHAEASTSAPVTASTMAIDRMNHPSPGSGSRRV
jgi:hypothetical protein